jgi:hypothetical protein
MHSAEILKYFIKSFQETVKLKLEKDTVFLISTVLRNIKIKYRCPIIKTMKSTSRGCLKEKKIF